MNSKEKAKELVDKFTFARTDEHEKYVAKQCALIAIDEMLNFNDNLFITEGSLAYKYLQEVKQEIIKQ